MDCCNRTCIRQIYLTSLHRKMADARKHYDEVRQHCKELRSNSEFVRPSLRPYKTSDTYRKKLHDRFIKSLNKYLKLKSEYHCKLKCLHNRCLEMQSQKITNHLIVKNEHLEPNARWYFRIFAGFCKYILRFSVDEFYCEHGNDILITFIDRSLERYNESSWFGLIWPIRDLIALFWRIPKTPTKLKHPKLAINRNKSKPHHRWRPPPS